MEPPRLILLRGGRSAEKPATEKRGDTNKREIIYRADYTHWWRLPPPLPPRPLPLVRLGLVLAVIMAAGLFAADQ